MEWIDVKDRLPEVLGEAVLVWANFDNSSQDCKIGFLVQESYRGVIRDIDPSPLWSINGEFKTWPTHWQPLPTPPEVSSMNQPDVHPNLEGNIGRRAYDLWQQAHPDSELEFPGTLSVMAWLIEEYEGSTQRSSPDTAA